MTDYAIQAKLAEDDSLLKRVTACVAGMGITQPQMWVYDKAWPLAVTDGWCCAVSDSGNTRSLDSSAITDEMIRDRVNELLHGTDSEEQEPDEPDTPNDEDADLEDDLPEEPEHEPEHEPEPEPEPEPESESEPIEDDGDQ